LDRWGAWPGPSTQRARKTSTAIPFVFVTGYGEAGADERFAERPVLKKPFRPEELREALRHLVAED
jgi:CheY-like chemotaxis protein